MTIENMQRFEANARALEWTTDRDQSRLHGSTFATGIFNTEWHRQTAPKHANSIIEPCKFRFLAESLDAWIQKHTQNSL